MLDHLLNRSAAVLSGCFLLAIGCFAKGSFPEVKRTRIDNRSGVVSVEGIKIKYSVNMKTGGGCQPTCASVTVQFEGPKSKEVHCERNVLSTVPDDLKSLPALARIAEYIALNMRVVVYVDRDTVKAAAFQDGTYSFQFDVPLDYTPALVVHIESKSNDVWLRAIYRVKLDSSESPVLPELTYCRVR